VSEKPFTPCGPVLWRKRPATVMAWHWDGTPEAATLIVDWVNTHNFHEAEKHPHENIILIDPKAPPTMSVEPLKPKMWLIKDTFGDFYPLPDDVFRATYEHLV
jgi:hypothetical protein